MVGSPWGGSEELWTRTAVLLTQQGVSVAASIHGWPQLDRRITQLPRLGVDVQLRPYKPSLISYARRYMSGESQIAFDIRCSFGNASPDLVVISNGTVFSPIELVEMCIDRRWPFATIAHSNFPVWPSDEMAARLRKALPLARRCFFVSEANLALAERQLGFNFNNAEIVRNPVVIEIDSPIPWPPHTSEYELRMACVGNLYPTEKGQDILLDVLAKPCWTERNWRLTFYGNGPNRNVLERLVRRLKLGDRVSFGGYVAPETIWNENHILVMPSRYEGMPLAVVEAMFCGRPVVATNVGGNSEVIKDGITGFLAEAAAVETFGSTLERMWGQRDRLEEIGKLAAASIRRFIPNDPVGIFAEKLKSLAAVKEIATSTAGNCPRAAAVSDVHPMR
jgi:glycosyltransferase involved in cell wall biosynthesis